MENLLSVVFEAHHTEKNHHRRYQVTLGRDLFNDWTLAICYGRCGQAGQEKRFAGSTDGEMKAIIRDRLHRRLSAPKRIGCSYRLSSFNATTGFDAFAWLPGEIMAEFFET